MKRKQLLEFWAEPAPCNIQFEEACCFVAAILKNKGVTCSADIQHLLEKEGYYKISGRTLNRVLTFISNEFCSVEEDPWPLYTDKLEIKGPPQRIYILSRTPDNVETIDALAEIWAQRIAPRAQLPKRGRHLKVARIA